MRHPLHLIVGVDPKAKWREINLNAEAAADDDVRLSEPNLLLDPKQCDEFVKDCALAHGGADYTYGGYMEDRSTLWRGHYMKRGRFTHYGVDINVPAGTLVRCPLDFTVVELYCDNDQGGGWGERALLKTESGYVVFAHVLFGEHIRVGRPYPAGTPLGEVAKHFMNGGWYPHLHLQGLRSLDLLANLDGYGKRYPKMRLDYPDPLDMLLPFPS